MTDRAVHTGCQPQWRLWLLNVAVHGSPWYSEARKNGSKHAPLKASDGDRFSMTSMLLHDKAVALALGAEDPEERFLTTGVDWQQYESLLAQLRDSARYRVTYLEGMLDIMSPSRQHELQKKNISRLLEAYFEETRTRFWGLGSTTFRRQEQQGGTEPDECYCLGEEEDISRPRHRSCGNRWRH